MNFCRFSKIGALAPAAIALACTVTPIDAVSELESGDSGSGSSTGTLGTGGSSATASATASTGTAGTGGATLFEPNICDAVDIPSPGRYYLKSRSTGACLRSGDPTPIRGTSEAMGVEVLQDPNCGTDLTQIWWIQPYFEPFIEEAQIEVRNTGLDLNLDMEAAAVYDGTRAVLYDPHDMENQRFEFIPMGADYYQVRPTHVANACLQAMPEGDIEMYGCDLLESAQQWQLARGDCP